MSKEVHTLNNSPSKQRYSFGKEGRFKYGKPQTDAYYLPNTQKDKRSALIGYGQRSLGVLHAEKIYQSVPHAYNIPTSIEERKGYAFKSGGRYQIGGYLQHLKQFRNKPGPDAYQQPSLLQSKKFSLKAKLPDFSAKSLINVPGPGAYSIPSTMRIEQSSKILDSRFMNPSSLKIHNSLDISRRREPVTFVPGPGSYDVQKYGIGNPQNPLGKNEFSKFPHAIRESVSLKGSDKLPGPGLQQLFPQHSKMYSQFD